jgi:hypothetical protein
MTVQPHDSQRNVPSLGEGVRLHLSHCGAAASLFSA